MSEGHHRRASQRAIQAISREPLRETSNRLLMDDQFAEGNLSSVLSTGVSSDVGNAGIQGRTSAEAPHSRPRARPRDNSRSQLVNFLNSPDPDQSSTGRR